MIDAELVARKILLINEDLRALEPLAVKPLAAYLASPTDELVAERYLERIIGRMIDLNYHVLTAAGHPPPKDYYQSFTALAGAGILEAGFAARIAASAGLRNRIAHAYEDIDPARVHAALGPALRDVPEYLRRIAAHAGI